MANLNNSRWNAFPAFLFCLLFVVYGSLIPFDLRDISFDQAVLNFSNIKFLDLGIESRADWIANIILYMPLAFFGCAFAVGMRAMDSLRYFRALIILVLCLGIAVAVEFAQTFFAPRTVSLNDLVAEGFGSLLGIFIFFLGRWNLVGLWRAFDEGGRASLIAAIVVYSLAYLALSLFPFDFVMSSDELEWKFKTANQGWLFAGSSGLLRGLAGLISDGVTLAPIGMLLMLAFPGLCLRRLFIIGMALGAVLEFAQLFLASGISQGLSVVMKGIGLAAGGMIGKMLSEHGPAPLARIMRSSVAFLIFPYFLALTILAGWYSSPWGSLSEAMEKLHQISFVPFYHHYFTSEAVALTSLLGQVAMFAPVGLGIWAVQSAGNRPGSGIFKAGLYAAALALVIEMGKLMVPGKHPDLTNLLIVWISAGFVCSLANWLERVILGVGARSTKTFTKSAITPKSAEDTFSKPVFSDSPRPESHSFSDKSEPLRVTGLTKPSKPAGTTDFSEAAGSSLPHKLLAILTLGVLLIFLFYYPGSQIIIPLLVMIMAITYKFHNAWLLLLPALLPIFNLAPWSGSFFLEEFDLFLTAIMASCLWNGQYRMSGRSSLTMTAKILLAAFMFSSLMAMVNGLLPLQPLDENAFSSYFSHYNALRIAKGFFWPVVLLPPLFSALTEQEERSKNLLTMGIMAGLLATGLAVIWERGFFASIFGGGGVIMAVRQLLDFGTDDRATALFSEMHNGGEAIDGYLALALPFAAIGIFSHNPRWLRIISSIGLLGGVYAAMVTFSRGSYLAVAVIALVLLSGIFKRHQVFDKTHHSSFIWIGLLLGLGSAMTGFERGQVPLMLVSISGFLLTIGLSYLLWPVKKGLFVIALACLAGLGIFVFIAFPSVPAEPEGNLLASAPMVVLMFILASLAGVWAGMEARISITARALVTGLLVAGISISLAVPALLGTKMKERFGDTFKDLETRKNHWSRANDLMNDGWGVKFFGMGLGVFPRTYYYSSNEGEVGNAGFNRENNNIILTMSGGQDFRLGQRVNLDADQSYTLALEYRTKAEEAQLYLRVCRRNIIQMLEWNPDCVTLKKKVGSTRGNWEPLIWKFQMGAIGNRLSHIGRRPLTLEIMNRREYEMNLKPMAVVDFDNIALTDSMNRNLITNGDFSEGMNHWFPYSDFNHLPWHIKNLWVDMYFEQGLLGLLIFFGVILYSLVKSFNQRNLFALGARAALLGFLSVGMVGTLIDVPRIMVLFWLIAYSQWPKLGRRNMEIKPTSLRQ